MPQNILQLRLLLLHNLLYLSLDVCGILLLVLEVLGPIDLIPFEKLVEVAMINLQALMVVLQIAH